MSELPNPGLSGARDLSADIPKNSTVWSLRPWWRAALLVIPVVAGAVWMGAAAVRVARSAAMLDSLSISDLQKAVARDPNNPDLINRLGLVYTYDQTDINISESLKNLRQAVALNPRRWDFWSDLGTACDYVVDTPCADSAFAHAWALNPEMPTLGWKMGNHYLLTNRPEQAFPFFRRLLKLSPDYLEPTFRLCLRATHDPELIYAQVLPHGRDAFGRFSFLNFLVSTGDYDDAMKIWGQMISGPDHAPNVALIKPFLDFLIDHERLQEAGTVWSDLQHVGAVPAATDPSANNLLYNGSFNQPPINTGFDWRISNSPDLVFDFSDTSAGRARKCVRIDFSVGRNANYELLSQVVRVEPSTAYQLTANVRSDSLTSESGPRLRVTELGCNNCNIPTSDDTQGTTPWHPIEVSFATHAQTQAVQVTFWRPEAPGALGDITGTVWLDDINLHAVAPAHPDPKLARTQ